LIESLLKELLEPSSLTIIGASANPAKISHEILRNILKAGCKDNIFPVNPRTPEILGLEVFPSVEDIPIPVELAIIVIPSTLAPKTLNECSRKKVKAAIIISGGFRETGEMGKELEKK